MMGCRTGAPLLLSFDEVPGTYTMVADSVRVILKAEEVQETLQRLAAEIVRGSKSR